jgi:hypothetical protein
MIFGNMVLWAPSGRPSLFLTLSFVLKKMVGKVGGLGGKEENYGGYPQQRL